VLFCASRFGTGAAANNAQLNTHKKQVRQEFDADGKYSTRERLTPKNIR
jgi:hypothetical protein